MQTKKHTHTKNKNTQKMKEIVRSEGSEGTTNRACTQWQRQQEKRKAQYMDDAQTLFSLDDADCCREMKCQRVS